MHTQLGNTQDVYEAIQGACAPSTPLFLKLHSASLFLYLREEILFLYLIQSFQNRHSGEHRLYRIKQKDKIFYLDKS